MAIDSKIDGSICIITDIWSFNDILLFTFNLSSTISNPLLNMYNYTWQCLKKMRNFQYLDTINNNWVACHENCFGQSCLGRQSQWNILSTSLSQRSPYGNLNYRFRILLTFVFMLIIPIIWICHFLNESYMSFYQTLVSSDWICYMIYVYSDFND